MDECVVDGSVDGKYAAISMKNSFASISIAALQKAVVIREKIETLQSELVQILGGGDSMSVKLTKRKMSASARRKIAAAQRLRWAKVKGTTGSTAQKKGKRKTSAAARAKMAAAAKARWASAKAAGKNSL